MVERKKAQGVNVLRVIILTLIIGFVLILIVNKMIVNLRGDLPREVCRASVLAKYGTKLPGVGTENLAMDLQCFPQMLKFDETGIEKVSYNGISRKKFWLKKFKGLDSNEVEETIHRALANEMYDCWYQFHRGEFDFFGDWSGDITRCVVCSDVIFDSTLTTKLSNRNSLTGFQKYLLKTNVPKAEYSYLMYFFNVDDDKGVAADLQKINSDLNDKLELNKQYSIVFSMGKSSAWEKIYTRTFAATATGLGIGAALGFGPGSLITAPVGAAIFGGAGFIGSVVMYGVFEADVPMPGMVIKETSELGEICNTLY